MTTQSSLIIPEQELNRENDNITTADKHAPVPRVRTKEEGISVCTVCGLSRYFTCTKTKHFRKWASQVSGDRVYRY